MKRWLDWLLPAATDSHMAARFRLYRHDIGDYMSRYILHTPWFTLRLHNIRREDMDRHLHDHPWDFTSLILTGWYIERLPTGEARTFYPFELNRHKAEDLHKLEVVGPGTWTLVWSGPIRRKWGFQTEDGWVYWRTYLDVAEADLVSRGGNNTAPLDNRTDAR